MHQVDLVAEFLSQLPEARLRGREIDLLRFIDERADPIGTFAFTERTADGIFDFPNPREAE